MTWITTAVAFAEPSAQSREVNSSFAGVIAIWWHVR